MKCVIAADKKYLPSITPVCKKDNNHGVRISILEHIVQVTLDNGIVDIIMIVSHGKEDIMTYFGNGKAFGVNISYVEQDPMSDEDEAFMQVVSVLQKDKIPYLVLQGDRFIDKKIIRKMIEIPKMDALDEVLEEGVDVAVS